MSETRLKFYGISPVITAIRNNEIWAAMIALWVENFYKCLRLYESFILESSAGKEVKEKNESKK